MKKKNIYMQILGFFFTFKGGGQGQDRKKIIEKLLKSQKNQKILNCWSIYLYKCLNTSLLKVLNSVIERWKKKQN